MNTEVANADEEKKLKKGNDNEWPLLPQHQQPSKSRMDVLLEKTPNLRQRHEALQQQQLEQQQRRSPIRSAPNISSFIPTFSGGGDEDDDDDIDDDQIQHMIPDELYDEQQDDQDERELQQTHGEQHQ